MINIGEISKPGVSERPVKSKRSTSNSELVTPAESIDAQAKYSPESQHKNGGSGASKDLERQKNKQENTEQVEVQIDDTTYDEKGIQHQHGRLDIEA